MCQKIAFQQMHSNGGHFDFFATFSFISIALLSFLNLSTKHDKMSLKRKQGRVCTGLFWPS